MTTSDATRPSAAGQQVPAPAPAGMANPAPWAVTAFATTSFMLGMDQTGPGITDRADPRGGAGQHKGLHLHARHL
jgi:hypothetical protein